MPDVMAIISKAVFEADAKHAKVGDVLPIDRYTSTHKAFEALEGGRIFLVTVRPPEELWLVAVLEKPKRAKGAWVAAKNTTPIRALPDFRKRLKAKKGRLAMSLQTPRALAPEDAALLVAAPEEVFASAKKEETKRSDLVHVERPLGSDKERLEHLRDHGTVGHLLYERELLKDNYEKHAAIVRAIDPARLLQRQLRAGLLEELCWPAQEEAAERLGSDVLDWQGVDTMFPYIHVRGPKMDRIVVAGPDGIVADVKLKLAKAKEIWRSLYVEGDVLVVYEVGERMEGIWASQNKPFKADTFWPNAVVPGVGVTTGEGRAIERGTTALPKYGKRVLVEDGHYFRLTEDAHWEEFEPRTGRAIRRALPSRFQGRKGLLFEQSSIDFLVWREKDKALRAEGADGRSFVGAKKGHIPERLITMPEREGLYLVRQAARDDRWSELVAPDGRTVVIPGYPWRTYWAGAPQELPIEFLSLFGPRDPAGSRLLRDCDEKTARALLDAARIAYAKNPNDDFDWDTYETIRPNHRWPELATAVRSLFPSIRDERLIAGIVAFAIQGAKADEILRGYTDALEEKARMPAPRKSHAKWSDGDLAFWTRRFRSIQEHEGNLATHLRRVDQFLFSDEPCDRWKASMATTRIWWEPLLMHARGLVWRLFAPGTPKDARKEFRKLLGLWATTELAKRTNELRYVGATISQEKLEFANFNVPHFFAATNRYIVRQPFVEQYYVVERTIDGTFVDLPGAEVGFDHRPPPFELEAALAIYDERGPLPFPTQAITERIANGTGLGVDAAMPAWSGVFGFEWDTSKENRAALGLKVAALARAAKEIDGALFDEIYAEAMPDDARSLFSPLAPGKNGESAVDRFVRAWTARQGKQTPVDPELVVQLESDLPGAPIAAIHAAQVLTAPEEWPHFVKDARWVIRPYGAFASNVSYKQGYIPAGWPKTEAMGEEEETNRAGVFDGRVLRFYLRYLPWAYQDLPAGHPVRANAGTIGARIRERLANPNLLLLAGAVDLSRQTEPKKLAVAFESIAERFRGPPYAAKGAHAEGYDRGDLVVTWPKDDKNGLFFAFRPSTITNPESLERFARDLGIADVFRKTSGGCACGLNFGRYDVVDLTDFDPWLAWIAPGFQALVDELIAPRVAKGRFASDPRACRPDLVERVRRENDLDEDSATLFLQVLTLADPTPKRILRSNGWEMARHDRAADALVRRKLVNSGKQPRTSRTIFGKGEVLLPKSPAAPIEASKAPLYGLDPESDAALRPPFGVVLPLEPLDRLFERVSQGISMT